MTNHERLEVLGHVPELRRFGDVALRTLLSHFDEVIVPAGVVLAQAGCLCHEFVVVAHGELEVCRHGRAWRLGPGGTFGWEAMQTRGRNDATVVTTSPARLLVMSHAQFRAAEGLATASVRSRSRAAA